MFRRLRAAWPPLAGMALVLVLKLTALLQLAGHPLLQPRGVLDDAVYLKLAERVAGGDLALGPDVYYLSPFYTYFLGAILALGGSVFTARLVQVLLGTAAVALIGLTARRWFGARAAWVAAGAAALTGLFTFNEILLLQSSVDPFLSALALFLLARALDGGRLPAFAGAGAALGALAINRPNSLAAALVVGAVWLLTRRSRQAIVQLAALALGLTLIVAPVAIRNRVVAGEWALVTSHGGLNFYIGNHAGAAGTWSLLPGISPSIEGQSRDAARVASAALGRPATPREASGYYYSLGWRWIREHPVDASLLWLKKLGLTLSATDVALNYSYTYYARDEATLLSAMVVGPWLLVPLGLVGLVLGLRVTTTSASAGYAAWASFVPAYAATLVVFFVASRYRLPLLAALCVGAGCSVATVWQAVAARHWRELSLVGSGIAVLVVVAWIPLEADTGRQYERGERIVRFLVDGHDAEADALLAKTEPLHPERGVLLYRVGLAWQQRGDPTHAATYLERALTADPNQADIRFSLGEALLALGRAPDAIPHLEAARRAGVEPYTAGLDLVHAYLALGRPSDIVRVLQEALGTPDAQEQDILPIGAEALQHGHADIAEQVARLAVARWPQSGAARDLLGVALMVERQQVEGEQALRDAVRLDPSSATAAYHLALALAQAGRRTEAARLVEQAVRLQPNYPEAQQLLLRLR